MMKMKRTVFILTLLLTTALALFPVNAQEVRIPDANLADAIREELGLGAGARITAAAMRNLTRLEAYGLGIADLTGLAHAVNLTNLQLGSSLTWIDGEFRYNPIFNVSPLANLTHLQVLNLHGTDVSDISGLANLTNLKNLDIRDTDVSDISALANLTNLKNLDIRDTDVSDISALANHTRLQNLDIRDTDVSDISALANHTHLQALDIRDTDVSDISALANLTELQNLYLDGTGVSDISALANHRGLDTLVSSRTKVSDISVLANLRRLRVLYLGETDVSDISALANLTELVWLNLNDTDVSDISVVANLTRLRQLHLNDTDVSDISVVANLTKLEVLGLVGCPLSPASQTLAATLRADGLNVTFDDMPEALPPPSAPTWKFERSFHPHSDELHSKDSVEDIGFRGNSQVFFGRGSRLYKWDMSARRYWWVTHGSLFSKWVQNVEVSQAHDIVAYTLSDKLYLRRASDLSFIDSVVLPANRAVTLSMGPRTNYVIVAGDDGGGDQGYTRTYDLWENDSWGLNPRRHNAGTENAILHHVDILNYDYAYGVYKSRDHVEELSYRNHRPWTGLNFDPPGFDPLVAVAAGKTSSGNVRIAGATSGGLLFLWDWYGNLLKSLNVGTTTLRSFQFTPNGELLTWIDDEPNGDDQIRFHNMDMGYGSATIRTFVKTADHICHALSKDGKTVAAGLDDGSVRIYKWTGASALAAPAKEVEPVQPTALLSNYPNPFNPETWIPYRLSDPAEVTVSIYSVDGRLVRTLELGQMPAGVYSDKDRAAYWDGRNASGEPVASGVYFYTLTAGDFKATRKMVIRK